MRTRLAALAALPLLLTGCDPHNPNYELNVYDCPPDECEDCEDCEECDDDDTGDDDTGDDDTGDDDTGDDDTGDDDTGDDDTGDDDTGDDDTGDDDTGDDDTGDDDTSGDDDTTPVECDREVPGDHATIQEAIDDADYFDVVCVDPGEYHERLDFDGKVVHLIGVGGSGVTHIDGDYLGTVLTFDDAEGADVIVEGFTVTAGAANEAGGAYFLYSAPTLRDVLFTDHHASFDGGALYLQNAAPTLERVVIEGNDAGGHGGGLYAFQSGGTLVDCRIQDNLAGESGGGVFASFSGLVLDGVEFLGNRSSERGGGLGVQSSFVELNHVRFEANEAVEGGGGILWHDAAGLVDDVVLIANNTSGDGGGMYLQTSSPTIRNTRIVDNFAVRGGGVFMTYASPLIEASVVAHNGAMGEGGGFYLQTASPQLTHLTVVGNDALLGGGLYLEGASPHVSELVVAHHDTGSGWYAEAGTIAIASSAVWDNQPANFEGLSDPTGTDGNLTAEPDFLDLSAASGLDWDLHLGAGSALVDAGDPGNADPDGGPADIGGFGGLHAGEWDLDDDSFPSWWQPGPYDPVGYPAAGWDCEDTDPSVYPGVGC